MENSWQSCVGRFNSDPRLTTSLAEFPVAKARGDVVVHHPRSLHVGVADRRADELETSLFQVLAHRVGLRRRRRDVLDRSPAVYPGRAVDELPQVVVERAELVANAERSFRIRPCGKDLYLVPHDALIGHEPSDLALAEPRHLLRIEA